MEALLSLALSIAAGRRNRVASFAARGEKLKCSAFYCQESRVGPISAPSIGVEAAF